MREETVLSLKWHSFPSHLAVSLDTCYEKQQFVDLSLVCKDGTILKCHKMVLANSSSFFRRLLMANDHPHPMIILHDIEADDLKTIVNFMYCGEIQVVQSEVRRLLQLAEILEVTGLRHIQTSVLVGSESNNANNQDSTSRKRLKIEEAKNLPAKTTCEHDANAKTQNKYPATRLSSASHTHKNIPKNSQDISRKNEECTISALNQRLETGKSGISIVDINDGPSTSRKNLQSQSCLKRKEPVADPVISWPRILSAISKDKPLPLKKLCIMEEVEITAGKPPTSVPEPRRNEPLDRRKIRNISDSNQTLTKCAVFIKDEIDLSSEIEDDTTAMDPLDVEEIDLESSDSVITSTPLFSYSTPNIEQTSFNSNTHSDFPPKKGSNG